MISKVFSVYDSKALLYSPPFYQPSTGGGVRAFADAVNDPQSMLFKHATDFVLFEIASFDDNKGLFFPVVPHINLGLGSDFLERKPPVVSKGAFPSVNEIREVVESSPINGGSRE